MRKLLLAVIFLLGSEAYSSDCTKKIVNDQKAIETCKDGSYAIITDTDDGAMRTLMQYLPEKKGFIIIQNGRNENGLYVRTVRSTYNDFWRVEEYALKDGKEVLIREQNGNGF